MKRASVQVWIFSRCNFGFLGVAKRALPGFSVSSRSCESFLFLFFISVAARIDPSSRPALSIRAWNTSSWSEKKKRAVWGFYWNLIGSRSLWRPRRWWWWTSFDQEEERTHIQKKKRENEIKTARRGPEDLGLSVAHFPPAIVLFFFSGLSLCLLRFCFTPNTLPVKKKNKKKRPESKIEQVQQVIFGRENETRSVKGVGRLTCETLPSNPQKSNSTR